MRTFMILLLTAVLLAGCGTTQSNATTTPATGHQPTTAPAAPPLPNMAESDIKPTQIESFEVYMRRSHPRKMAVLVSGELPDGCTEYHEATQVRDGNTIDVTITVIRYNNKICTLAVEHYKEAITLEGDFPPGDYTVRVNGITQRFTL